MLLINPYFVQPTETPFVGPLDAYTANLAGAWSAGRRLLSSYTGPLIRVRRSSDDAEDDFGYVDDADCFLNQAAVLAFTGAGNGFLVKEYDQSGGTNHLIQTTSSLQLRIVSSGVLQVVETRPKAMNPSTGGQSIFTTNAVSGAYSFYLVARNGAAGTGDFGQLFQLDTNLGFYDLSAGGNWSMYDNGFANSYDMGVPQNTWACHVMATSNAGGSDMTVRSDATEHVIDGQATPGTSLVIGAADIRTEFTEAVLYSAYHGSSTITAIQAILKNWVLPVLALTMAATVDSAIAGDTPATAKPLFSSVDHVTPAYTRNVDCWGAAWAAQLTALSVWNSEAAGQKAGVLITPRHVLMARHFQCEIGTTLRFVKADGTVVDRTIDAKADIPEILTLYPDVCICQLDSDVSAGIAFAKVLPDNWENYLADQGSDVPIFARDQENKLLVRDINALAGSLPMQRKNLYAQAPVESTRLSFYEAFISGDSGSPLCCLIDGQIVALAANSFGGPGEGSSAVGWKMEINTLLAGLDGGYQLTEVDLSGYKDLTV